VLGSLTVTCHHNNGERRVMPDEIIPDEMWRYFGHEPPTHAETPTPRTNVVPINGTHEKRGYQTLLRRECDKIAMTPRGRNDQFNKSAFDMAGFVEAGHLDRQEVEDALIEAGHHASRIGNHPFTDSEMHATLRSAFGSPNVRPKTLPDRNGHEVIEVDATTLQPQADNEPEARDLHQIAVTRRAYELRINEEARVLFQTQQADQLGQARPRPTLLRDFLTVPDTDARYRITDLLPTGGNVLLAAQQKAGKTSMMANLIRALADGGSFLGKFLVAPLARLTLIDNELDERMLRRWLREQGVHHDERVQIISLKGNISTFDIHNDHTRAQWADDIRGSQFVILDCLRPCLDALGLSEDKDAGRFLVAWDALKREAGVSESVVVHHMGHNQERSRGDSRLLDWPDVNWKIIKESQSETTDHEELDSGGGRRFFAAHGRDVMVSEGLLKWSETGRTLTYIDGGRREAKAIDAIDIIREILADPENKNGLGIVALTDKMHVEGIGKTIARRSIKKAIDTYIIIETDGGRNSKILTLNPSEAL
jgi:hypothetical protein